MARLVLVSAILPEKGEALRRFYQELSGSRRSDYELSRQRLGIVHECAWTSQLCRGEIAILTIETAAPEQMLWQVTTSELPFDRWFWRQLGEFYGFYLAGLKAVPATELIFEWKRCKAARPIVSDPENTPVEVSCGTFI
jgi:hypothetical protein